MSKYIYKLSNYRAVQSAEIEIDGITVLAGENGTGKSTLSRWLYYVVKVLCGYEELIDNKALTDMAYIVRRLERTDNMLDGKNFNQFALYGDMNDVLYSNLTISEKAEQLCLFVKQYISFINQKLLNHDVNDDWVRRLATLFDMENVKITDNKIFVDSIYQKLISQINEIRDEALRKKEDRKPAIFKEIIPLSLEDFGDGNVSVGFVEDGVELLTKERFNPTLNINKVIYYKTYELLDYLNRGSDFRDCLETPIDKMTNQEELVYRLICKAIDGNVTIADEEGLMVFHTKQLHYKRNDGLDIPLRQAATGLISFSYLARLLENGYLRKGTLLIIDEPEAHLHPRWIVEYARILVLLQKMLDLKIVLSTHNPDMVAAIDAIARKEGVADNTKFYFAKPSKEVEYKYVFEKQDSIGNIFDSFNVALTRIQAYGEE